jgi:hypothetical protein
VLIKGHQLCSLLNHWHATDEKKGVSTTCGQLSYLEINNELAKLPLGMVNNGGVWGEGL